MIKNLYIARISAQLFFSTRDCSENNDCVGECEEIEGLLEMSFILNSGAIYISEFVIKLCGIQDVQFLG